MQVFFFREQLLQYGVLIKFKLTFLVVFSSVMSYLLAPGVLLDWFSVFWLCLGGFLVAGAANTFNQILERDSDGLMARTCSRPVASGKMSVIEAERFGVLSLVFGLGILWYYFNIKTVLVSFISVASYAWLYTPLKKRTSFSVFVGAFPGAFPCLIGWVAGTDGWSLGGWVLFLLQFFWQFPHFWAIAWLAHGDYAKAGFRLLPSVSGPGRYSAYQSVLYTLLLLPLGFLPYLTGMSGAYSALVIFFSHIGLLYLAINLLRRMTSAAARWLMFGCYIYLPVLYFSLLLDKIVK